MAKQFKRFMVFYGDHYDNPAPLITDQPSYDAEQDAIVEAERLAQTGFQYVQVFDRMVGQSIWFKEREVEV